MLFLAAAGPLAAQVPGFVDGNFSQLSVNESAEFGTGYEVSGSPVETLTGWTTSGYNFVFLPTQTTAVGADGNLSLWSSTSSGAPNTFNNASPTGGNFIAADADYETVAITQTVTNLSKGERVAVSFAWAGAQQSGFTTATTEQWIVSLGSSTQSTSVVNNVSEGFTGWMNQTFTFVATGPTEVLSFLAAGTPLGVPPFALLANVTVKNVPEPPTWAVMGSGLLALAGVIACRRRVAA